MARSALLLIDIQQSFLHRPYWQNHDLPAFAARVSELIAGVKAANGVVVSIFHLEETGHFSKASGLTVPMDFLTVTPDVTIEKQVHNAFTGTDLGARLQALGVTDLIITGIRTEQCCETTARVGSDLGYRVSYVTEATLTFPMTHPGSGRTYSAAEIKERTELVLVDRFARIDTVASCLAQLAA